MSGPERDSPSYDLGEIKRRVRDGEFILSTKTETYISGRPLTAGDIRDCILGMQPETFSKSKPPQSDDHDTWSDVYFPYYRNGDWYLELTMTETDTVFVISFHMPRY